MTLACHLPYLEKCYFETKQGKMYRPNDLSHQRFDEMTDSHIKV